MRRYEGTGLPSNPRVAVIANDAIGNFVVATPLLQMIRRELKPSALHYFGGKRTWELQAASDLFDKSYALHGRPLEETLAEVDGPYNLVVNVEQGDLAKGCAQQIAGDGFVCGPVDALPYPDDPRGDLWRDRQWIAADLTQRYSFLNTPWIGEIYARLAYLDGPVPAYRVPATPVQHEFDVLIAMSASLPEKLWPLDHWREALAQLAREGLTVCLLGAPPKQQGQHWKGSDDEAIIVDDGLASDCRGMWSLPEVVGAIASAHAVLTLDNGIMHLAASTTTPTVALFRNGIHRLWTPPVPSIHPVVANPDCMVADIPVEAVVNEVLRVL